MQLISNRFVTSVTSTKFRAPCMSPSKSRGKTRHRDSFFLCGANLCIPGRRWFKAPATSLLLFFNLFLCSAGRACSSVPAYLRDRRSARSLSKARQRHRSHAQTIRALARGLSSMARSHPLTGEHAKACCLVGGGGAPHCTSSAVHSDSPPRDLLIGTI